MKPTKKKIFLIIPLSIILPLTIESLSLSQIPPAAMGLVAPIIGKTNIVVYIISFILLYLYISFFNSLLKNINIQKNRQLYLLFFSLLNVCMVSIIFVFYSFISYLLA